MLFSHPAFLPLAVSRGLPLCWKSLVGSLGFKDPAVAIQRKEQNASGLVSVPSLSSSPSEPIFCSVMSSSSFCLCSTYQKMLEPDDFSAEDLISLERSGSL